MYRDTELTQETLRDIMPLRKALRYDPNHGCANLQLLVFTISQFSGDTKYGNITEGLPYIQYTKVKRNKPVEIQVGLRPGAPVTKSQILQSQINKSFPGDNYKLNESQNLQLEDCGKRNNIAREELADK